MQRNFRQLRFKVFHAGQVNITPGVLPDILPVKGSRSSITTRRARVKILDGKVLERFADNSAKVIGKNYGKGMVITTPLTPGMAAFDKIILRGKPYTKADTAEGAALLDELLAYTQHSQYPVMLAGAGNKVMIESCRDTRNGNTIIQLLNFDVPMNPVPGKVLKPLTAKELEFRNPDNELVITMPEKITAATAVSPDYPEEHTLEVKHLSNGSSRITLKPQMLKIYTLITVKK